MASDDAPDADLDLDLLAASLRADAGDINAYTEALAVKLEEALPRGVRVAARAAGHVRAQAGPRDRRRRRRSERLELRCRREWSQHALVPASRAGSCSRPKADGFDEWVAALSRVLAEQAQQSLSTRQALERLLDA